jgi:hypothetical protein
MPGSKRRKAIAVLLFAQAALFGWGLVVTVQFLMSRTGDQNLVNQLELAIEQAAGFAVSALLAVLNWRGSRPALYGTAVFSGISLLIDLALAAIELMWAGPYALIFLLFFPLPSVPIGVVAIPVFILSLTLVWPTKSAAAAAPTPSVRRDPPESDIA